MALRFRRHDFWIALAASSTDISGGPLEFHKFSPLRSEILRSIDRAEKDEIELRV
jgi:hypothetical protein